MSATPAAEMLSGAGLERRSNSKSEGRGARLSSMIAESLAETDELVHTSNLPGVIVSNEYGKQRDLTDRLKSEVSALKEENNRIASDKAMLLKRHNDLKGLSKKAVETKSSR